MLSTLMRLPNRPLIALAAAGSAALLLAAFGFQYLGGLAPCQMCLWQRWPHAAAIGIGVLGLALPGAGPALLGALAMAGNAGLALYHTGVERAWWVGPNTCGAGAAEDMTALSADALLDTTTGPELVLCNQVAWEFLGLSMASWNGLACLGLAAMWLIAARARPA